MQKRDVMLNPIEHDQEYDSSGSAELIDLVRLAAEICSTPISLVSSLDGQFTHVVTSIGTSQRREDRSRSFCTHTVQERELLVVEDATTDPRFAQNPNVTPSDGIRFYAGVPISSESGIALGVLCVVDYVAKSLTSKQIGALKILGRQVQVRMELLTKNRLLEAALEEKTTLERELRNANRLSHAFLNAGPFVSYIKNAEGRYVFYNDQLRRRFDVQGDAWLGRSDHEVLPQEVAQALRAHDIEVLSGDRCVELEETTLAADGSVTPWKSYKFPFRNEDGAVMLAGLSIDVSTEIHRREQLEDALNEQLQLTEELRSVETAMQAFMHHTPHQCFLKNAQGQYIFYNRAFARFFGIDGAAWLGKTDYDVFPEQIAQTLRFRDLDLLDDGAVDEMLDTYQLEDGTERKLRSTRFTYRGFGGQRLIAGLMVEVEPKDNSHGAPGTQNDNLTVTLPLVNSRFRATKTQEQESFDDALCSK